MALLHVICYCPTLPKTNESSGLLMKYTTVNLLNTVLVDSTHPKVSLKDIFIANLYRMFCHASLKPLLQPINRVCGCYVTSAQRLLSQGRVKFRGSL